MRISPRELLSTDRRSNPANQKSGGDAPYPPVIIDD